MQNGLRMLGRHERGANAFRPFRRRRAEVKENKPSLDSTVRSDTAAWGFNHLSIAITSILINLIRNNYSYSSIHLLLL